MLYGHGKRGTEGPTFVCNDNTSYWDYFAGQIQWRERLAESPRAMDQYRVGRSAATGGRPCHLRNADALALMHKHDRERGS